MLYSHMKFIDTKLVRTYSEKTIFDIECVFGISIFHNFCPTTTLFQSFRSRNERYGNSNRCGRQFKEGRRLDSSTIIHEHDARRSFEGVSEKVICS